MKLLFVNNVRLELLQSLSNTASTMLVSKADVPFNNPIISAQLPDFQEVFIRLTIVDDLDPSQIEIVTVTGIVAETATTYQFQITRGEEGTQPQAFDFGSLVYMAHTAESINRPRPQFIDDVGDVTIDGEQVGDLLYWNGSEWENRKPDLGELNDVINDDLQIGQFLIWNGSTWINATITTSIDDATDTNINNPQVGDILIWNGNFWVNGRRNLNDLDDTELTNLQAEQFLVWDGDNWINRNITLSETTDTEITNPQVGDILIWNGNVWVNGRRNLNDLDDTELTSLQSEQFLVWDGNNWINRFITIAEATDTDIDDPQEDQLLVWNGTEWKNCTIDYFKDSSVTITIGTFGDQAIPLDTDVLGVVSESALLSGEWKAISKPEGEVEIDLRVSDFGTNPEPADSILNGNPIVITDTRYNNGTSNDLQNFLLEKGKVLSLVIVSTDEEVEWVSLTLDGRVVISTEKTC